MLRVDTKEDLAAYFELWDEHDALLAKFNNLRWVQAVLDKREEDNLAKVPMEGREMVVTQGQYILVRKLRGRPHLFGYDLIAGDH
jgi:hypothetical protein